ncbi:MAG TPA: hypothetical protein VED66_11545 [Candidatus Sulfotelmatobacter sp.]|nr:hypothetical protein [Candidatus Sulfotelmatobacter sp.]
METISAIGGSRIGWVNATWPFAKLVVSSTHLRLATNFLDTYDFLPSEVVSLESYGLVPFFARGIRIVHARPDYPPKIIFWYLGNPEALLERIRGAGFLPTAPASSETKWREFPARWTAILLFILVWNGLFLIGNAGPRGPVNRPGLFTLAPLFLAFMVSWGTKKSLGLQRLILKDGHSVNEIRASLSLIQVVTGVLLIIFSILLLTHTFG